MNDISFSHPSPLVCVQGLGFVGMAMAIAVADAKNANGDVCFNVIGVDLPNEAGLEKIDMVNRGHLPIVSNDPDLKAAFERVIKQGNLTATSDPDVYQFADIVVVDKDLLNVGASNPALLMGGKVRMTIVGGKVIYSQ